ncbi:MAG TPA: glycosyltransferase family 2 protein [Burkholderiales bacterium]|nr:glycosyltransferase family 2 protein [Burkholderiales bacterium]
MSLRPQITVVVCTRDRRALLEQCLTALRKQTYPDFEVLVIDNAPREPARDICVRFGVRYIVEPVAGSTHARNAGARAARGELIAYTDDDAVPDSGWLAALASEFRDPTIAAVTGSIRYFKARENSREMSHEEVASTVRLRARFDRSTSEWFTRAALGGVGDGAANMAFRRMLFDRHRFDHRLGRGRVLEGGDEHVMLASIISHGHVIAHCPEAVVRHPSAGTPSARRAERLRAERTSIAYLLFLWSEFPSHRGEIARFVLRALSRRLSGTGGRWPTLRACLTAPIVYWRARSEWSGSERPAQLEPQRRWLPYVLRYKERSTLE